MYMALNHHHHHFHPSPPPVFGLKPGFEYRIQVRGVNEEKGPWSEASYSNATHPTLPDTPQPAFIEERQLTQIKFSWHAPDGGGTAITGYHVHVQHTGECSLWPL